MKISWTEHRSNQEVLDMADENSSLMNTIRQWQKNWLRGHMLRNESLLCTVLEGRMEGTRTRGRQSATMIDWMKSNDVEYEHIKKRSYDREDWRHWRPGPAWNGRALRGEIVDRKWSTYIAISEKHKYVVQGTTTEPAPELANRETVVEHFALWLMKQIWSKSDLVEGRTDARTHGWRFWKQYQPVKRVKMKRQGHNVNLYLRLNSDTKWHKKLNCTEDHTSCRPSGLNTFVSVIHQSLIYSAQTNGQRGVWTPGIYRLYFCLAMLCISAARMPLCGVLLTVCHVRVLCRNGKRYGHSCE